MPVTVYPVKDLQANVVKTSQGRLSSPQDFLQNLPSKEISSTAGQIFQSSFVENCQSKGAGQGNCQTDLSQTPVISSVRGNGLVDTVLEAYNKHHHLILRPDDIWTAILSGFSFYVNKHSEELRSYFVAHEGRKQLNIHCGGTRHTVDFGNLAQQFTDLMHENLVDKSLKEWILPDFSTTTDNDRRGEREDWVKLHQKLDKLGQFGEETATWASLLDPILKRFILTFDSPDSQEVSDFWNRIAREEFVGSGSPELSGWITAFCFFNHEGRIQPIQSFVGTQPLVLDGVEYPIIAIKDIPTAFATVPVHLNDNGEEFDTEMVSGSVAMKLSSSDAFNAGNPGDLTAVQPLSGWAMYEKVNKKDS
ncbi:hypothetical protein AAP_02795 [Ascosphaera apis ARSEF 7405]|uniref:DUF4419 domain-containing protein n=1 Tax=Ascosphaera apis ARSEF 7405 TaxID=392613 RepID=A0A167ZIP4_9EURO|nr:hypothetical protein AAP_02795 [Ascosphaera apis ARSEF 7405]